MHVIEEGDPVPWTDNRITLEADNSYPYRSLASDVLRKGARAIFGVIPAPDKHFEMQNSKIALPSAKSNCAMSAY